MAVHEDYISNSGNVTIIFDDALDVADRLQFISILSAIEFSTSAGGLFQSNRTLTIVPGISNGWDQRDTIAFNRAEAESLEFHTLADGSIIPATVERIFTHEFVHAILRIPDLVGVDGLTLVVDNRLDGLRYIENLADPNSDYLGQTVRITNAIVSEVYGLNSRGHYLNGLGEDGGVGGDINSPIDQVIHGAQQSVRDLFINRVGSTNPDGSDSRDLIIGGEGNERIDAGGGFDFVFGGGGNDIIRGGAGSDTIEGGVGNDIISGGADGDTIEGGIGNDILLSGDATDLANITSLSPTQILAAMNDVSYDILIGGAGDDDFYSNGGDLLIGGAGVDQFYVGLGGEAPFLPLPPGPLGPGPFALPPAEETSSDPQAADPPPPPPVFGPQYTYILGSAGADEFHFEGLGA